MELARENIILDKILRPKPEVAGFPLESIYDETIIRPSAQSELERNVQNAQQKMNWQNKYQGFIEVGIMCADKPWSLADRKTVLLLYLRIGVEEGRILNSKNQHIMIDTLNSGEKQSTPGRNSQALLRNASGIS